MLSAIAVGVSMRTNKIDPADLTKPLLTKQEVAAILGATVRFVDKRVSDGSLRAIKVGTKMVRFRRSDVAELLRWVPTVRDAL